ncbi:hypothetical protein UES1_224 [Escherichia phage UE-S1]|nr:hypothetical protein UES1_224 [Escherichia phage UE-S1]
MTQYVQYSILKMNKCSTYSYFYLYTDTKALTNMNKEYKDFYISKLKENEQAWIQPLIILPFNRYSLNRCTEIAIDPCPIKENVQYNQYYYILMLIYRK